MAAPLDVFSASRECDLIHDAIQHNTHPTEIQARITRVVEWWNQYGNREFKSQSVSYQVLAQKLYACILEENTKIGFQKGWAKKGPWEETIEPINIFFHHTFQSSHTGMHPREFDKLNLTDKLLLVRFCSVLIEDDYLHHGLAIKSILKLDPAVKEAMLENADDLFVIFREKRESKQFYAFFQGASQAQQIDIATHASKITALFGKGMSLHEIQRLIARGIPISNISPPLHAAPPPKLDCRP